MRRAWLFASGVLTVALALALACRPGAVRAPVAADPEAPADRPPLPAPAAGTLRARVVSWDVGFRPATEGEWVAAVVREVERAAADGVDVLAFPELFAAGLCEFAPDDQAHLFATRRMRDAVLPAVKRAARPDMLVCLGSYAHQEPGWAHAFNRAPVLVTGEWHFADKVHPTQGELAERPPVRPADVLPVFQFRGAAVAVLVCFSLEMPEVAAALKTAGVRLIVAPVATEDEDGAARILRCGSARAVELGAAVLVAPLVGELNGWKNVGSAALYLPAQKGIDHRPRESARRAAGRARDDFVVPWDALAALRTQPAGRPETRPFLSSHPFRVERR